MEIIFETEETRIMVKPEMNLAAVQRRWDLETWTMTIPEFIEHLENIQKDGFFTDNPRAGKRKRVRSG
jgi:glycerophosphoryl diester phosphodiesterase